MEAGEFCTSTVGKKQRGGKERVRHEESFFDNVHLLREAPACCSYDCKLSFLPRGKQLSSWGTFRHKSG